MEKVIFPFSTFDVKYFQYIPPLRRFDSNALELISKSREIFIAFLNIFVGIISCKEMVLEMLFSQL